MAKPIDPAHCGIYQITAPTGECYIGQSFRLKNRKADHFRYLKNGKHANRRLQTAYDTHEGALTFTIVEYCTREIMTQREQHWINTSNSTLNGTQFAFNPLLDPVANAKMRATVSTPEYKIFKSAIATEVANRPEIRAAKSKSSAERQNTPEAKAERSLISLGVFQNPTHIATHLAAVQQACNTPEHKARQSKIATEVNARPSVLARNVMGTTALWQDPEYATKVIAASIAGLNRPEVKAAMRAKGTALWDNPEHAARMTAAQAAGILAKKTIRAEEFGLIGLTLDELGALRQIGRTAGATPEQKAKSNAARAWREHLVGLQKQALCA